MSQTKKRPNKKAKAALKILEDSKLLANSKPKTEIETEQNFKSGDAAVKTSTANKIRPNKKRG